MSEISIGSGRIDRRVLEAAFDIVTACQEAFEEERDPAKAADRAIALLENDLAWEHRAVKGIFANSTAIHALGGSVSCQDEGEESWLDADFMAMPALGIAMSAAMREFGHREAVTFGAVSDNGSALVAVGPKGWGAVDMDDLAVAPAGSVHRIIRKAAGGEEADALFECVMKNAELMGRPKSPSPF